MGFNSQSAYLSLAANSDTLYVFDKTKTVEKFVISSGEHSQITIVQTVGDSSPRAAIGEKIYFFKTAGKTHVFDTTTETLSVIESGFNSSVYLQTAVAIGSTIWVLYNSIMSYIVNFPLSNNDILIQQSYNKNIIDILPAPARVQIGVRNVYKGNASNKAEFVDAYVHNGTSWVNVNTGGSNG